MAVHLLLTQFVDALEEVRSIRSAQRRARLSAGDHPVARSLGVVGASAVEHPLRNVQHQCTDAALALHEFRKRDVHSELGIDAVTHFDGDEGIEAEIAQRPLAIDARG